MKTYEERTSAVMDMVEKKRKNRRALVAGVSSSLACVVVLVVSLVLFLPFQTPTVSGGYQKVVDAVYSTEYRNNWELLNSELGSLGKKSMDGGDWASNTAMPEDMLVDSAAPNGIGKSTALAGDTNAREAYIENTNLQVADVKEGDVLKESTHYFYRLRQVSGDRVDGQDRVTDVPDSYYNYRSGFEFTVYEKAGYDTRCVATYRRFAEGVEVAYSGYEMYLNDACTTVTIVYAAFVDNTNKTGVMQLDVSDLADIKLVREHFVSGDYGESRVIDGRLLVYTEYAIYDLTYDDPDTYIPYVQTDGALALTPADDIVCPDKVTNRQYAVLTLFDADLRPIGQTAMLGYGSDTVLYVNASRIYVAGRNVRADADKAGDTTDITCVRADANGLTVVGNFELYGIVDNQYWMDEYDGVFRVAATIRDYNSTASRRGGWSLISTRTSGNNASLYCYRVSDWTLVGRVERFAPEGESVQSARFVGTKAYVCTALVVTFTDPVYCFDLSDYAHITHTDTGAIDGYSTSLIPFADGTLLGIGVLDRMTLKLDVYRETGEAVETVDSLSLGGVVYDEQDNYVRSYYYDAITEYKSYLLDVADGVVGVPCYVSGYDNDEWLSDQCYLLFTYREGKLRLARSVSFVAGVDRNTRAALADGYIYIFGSAELKVVALADLD